MVKSCTEKIMVRYNLLTVFRVVDGQREVRISRKDSPTFIPLGFHNSAVDLDMFRRYPLKIYGNV